MNRHWLMSSVSLPDLMVHRWVCAELKRIRAEEAQPKAA